MGRDDQRQVRYTLEDCLDNQRRLSDLLKMVIAENRCLTAGEKTLMYSVLPKALLTQGATLPVNVVIGKGWFTFASVQNLLLRLADVDGNRLRLSTSRPEEVAVMVDIGELWQFVYDKVLYFFPLAASEALHLSGENVPRVEQGVFSFSAKDSLDKGGGLV